MAICNAGVKGKLFLGAAKVKSVYQGAAKVYSSGNIVTYHVGSGVSYQEEVDGGASCLSPASFVPGKEGYILAGWSLTDDGDVLDTLAMGDAPVTLYAVWVPDSISSTITAGGGYAQSPNFVSAYYGDPVDLTHVESMAVDVRYSYDDGKSDRYDSDNKYFYNTFRYDIVVSADRLNYTSVSTVRLGNLTYLSKQTYTDSIAIDVSSLSGNYYIGCMVKGYNAYKSESAKLTALSTSNASYSACITGIIFNYSHV